MSTRATAIHRRVRDAVRDTVSANRIQASAGPMTDETIDGILFRGAHQVMQSLSPYPREQAYALMPNVIRMMFMAFIEIDATEFPASGGEGWLPTAENINALPAGIRRYVHDLETRCDPAGDVQTMALQADTIRGLHAKVRELEAELASVRRKGERRQ